MASNRRGLPEINAGSMADIAFLLLIFFLVTTTMDAKLGINTTLPPWDEDQLQDPPEIHARNIYTILVNSNGDLLVEGEFIKIDKLKDGAKRFINNYGKRKDLSDKPSKAVISLQCQRGTEYNVYIQVIDELAQAYTELRNIPALQKFGKEYGDLKKEEQKIIRGIYPKKISEAEPKNK